MQFIAPLGPAGQSPAAEQVGAQSLPVGVVAHVQPLLPGGHAPEQSVSAVQLFGPPPMPPVPPVPPAGALPGRPFMSAGACAATLGVPR